MQPYHYNSRVTFKDLQKLVQSQQTGPEQSQSAALQRLRDKPFWYWGPSKHKSKDRATKVPIIFL